MYNVTPVIHLDRLLEVPTVAAEAAPLALRMRRPVDYTQEPAAGAYMS
jgi:hypothetical protein